METYSTFLHISDSLNNEEFLTNSTEHFQPILQFKATDDEPIRTIYETSHRIFHTGCHGTIIFSWNSKQNIEVQRYDYDERGSSGLQIIKEVAKKDNDAYFFGSLGTPGWCFVENILPLKYTGRYGLLILNLARKYSNLLKNIELLNLRTTFFARNEWDTYDLTEAFINSCPNLVVLSVKEQPIMAKYFERLHINLIRRFHTLILGDISSMNSYNYRSNNETYEIEKTLFS